MLVIVFVGLTAMAVIFYLLHRRYHARREAQWAQSTVPQPDINTWGPGQSVHDFGAYAASLKRKLSRGRGSQKNRGAATDVRAKSGGSGGSRNREKGKGAEMTVLERGVSNQNRPAPPMPTLSREQVEGVGMAYGEDGGYGSPHRNVGSQRGQGQYGRNEGRMF